MALIPSVSQHSARPLSATSLFAKMKKPSDPPPKVELPVIIPPFVPFPVVWGLPPHFMAPDPLTEIKLSVCRPPLARTPSESANDPVCLGRTDPPHAPPAPPKSIPTFTVITLPLVPYLSDLS